MKIKEITDFLEAYFPLHLQADYDNCGLQIGDLNQEVDCMMVTLTLDQEVVLDAISQNVHFILCHHPFFFNGIKKINYHEASGKIIQQCIENHITVYALHTCLDIGKEESMNLWIAKKLGVKNAHKIIDDLVVKGTIDTNTIGLAKKIKSWDFIEGVRYTYPTSVHTVAICGGSGSEYIDQLIGRVDCYITGDTKYHEMQYAYEHGLSVIDAGHFMENIMVEKTTELLGNLKVKVIQSKQKDYYHYI